MTSIPKPGLPTCSPGSPITRSPNWPHCCRGIGATRCLSPRRLTWRRRLSLSPSAAPPKCSARTSNSCLLWDLADEIDPEDGCLWIHGADDQQTIAFTPAGMEYLRELLAEHKRNRSSPRS